MGSSNPLGLVEAHKYYLLILSLILRHKYYHGAAQKIKKFSETPATVSKVAKLISMNDSKKIAEKSIQPVTPHPVRFTF